MWQKLVKGSAEGREKKIKKQEKNYGFATETIDTITQNTLKHI